MQVTPDEFARLLDAAVMPAPPNPTVSVSLAAESEIRDFVPYNQSVNHQFEKGFVEKLRYLRFHTLRFPTTASTENWDTLFDVWVKQCCFLEADYPGENVRVSVQSEVLEDVGTFSRWFLQWDPVSDSTSTGSPSTTTPKKVCMCIAIRVPDAQVPWDEFTHPSMDCAHALRSSLLPPNHPVRAFVSKLLKECEAEHCQHALVADATHTMRIQFTERALDPAFGGRPFVAYQMIPAATHSAPYYVAAIVSKYSRTFGLRSPRWRAAGPVSSGNDDSNERLRTDWQQRFRDWDFCELERDRALYERFLAWKEEQHAEALANPLLPGTVLSVERDVIPRKLTPLRCPFAWVPVPDDCTVSIFPRRPRCQQVDDLLAADTPLVFRLTRDLRVVDEEDDAAVPSEDDDEWEEEEDSEDEEEEEEAETLYSLVWTGQLGSALSGEFVETELCVKLFDERLFPVPALWQYDRDRSGRGGLYGLAFADELLRREEAVYARFSGSEDETCPHLQGLSLPHCYGFHEFTVEDGPGRTRTMLGVLMERIVGVHIQELLYDVFKKGSQWQRDEKIRLLKRLRNLVRILNHAHITHGRWDGAEVLCMRDTPWDFVLIDFAFASHHDGLRVAAGYGNDVGCLQGLLVESGIDFDVLSAVAWCEKDAWEE